MFARLGRLTVRRRMVLTLTWILLALLGGVFAGGVFDRMSPVADAPPGSEAAAVEARLDELDPQGDTIVAVISGEDFFTPSLRDSATAVMTKIRSVPGVVDVVDAYTSGGAIGDDGRSSLVTVELERGLGEEDARQAAAAVSDLLHTIAAPDVWVGGELLAEQAFVDRALTGAAIGEGITIVVLLVVLVSVLGGLRIGALPVVAALITIMVALLALRALVSIVPINEFAANIVTILALGLTVDYSLLMIMRYREERLRDPDADVSELMARTVESSGRAVLVSGLAVFITLVGVMLLGDPLLSGMALGGAVAVLLSTAAGLTLVPAGIAVVHRHLPDPGVPTWSRPWRRTRPAASAGALARSAAFAARRPVGTVIGATAVLLVLAAPAATLALDSSDLRSLPVDAEERVAYEAMTTRFTGLGIEPISVVVEASVQDPGVVALLDRLAALDGVAEAEMVAGLPAEVSVVEFTPEGDSPTGAGAQRLVREMRAASAEFEVGVGGSAAALVDTQSMLAQRVPLALGVVAAASFVLIFALTRSVIVPLKALAMSALTMGATVGVLVAVFQWGWGGTVLGFQPSGTLDVTTPLFIGLLAFGLTMDYEIFLLARIQEKWRDTGTTADPRRANREAVLHGIAQTGPVVTLAATCIAFVFLGFAASELVAMKEIGVGMLVALVLDVTIVRGLLLPATMTLLGRWNWWPARSSPARRDDDVTPAPAPAREEALTQPV